MGASPSKLNPVRMQPILTQDQYATTGTADITADILAVDTDLAGSDKPSLSADPALKTIALSQLFDSLGPAFFSPSPSSHHVTKIWTQHGGTTIPLPPLLIRSYQNAYLNIPLTAIEELNKMINAARLLFVMPNDPILHFIRNPYVVMYNIAWVGQCLEEGRLVSMSPYIITKPSGPKNEAEEAKLILERMAKTDQPTRHDQYTPVIHLSQPISADRPWEARNSIRKRRSKRRSLIIQPYMYFDIPDAKIDRPSTTSTSDRLSTNRARHQQYSRSDTLIRPAYTLSKPPARDHMRSRHRQASQSPYPMCRSPSFDYRSSPPSSPLPTTPLSNTRPPLPVQYTLDAELPSSIRMHQHSIDEQYQITMDAVDEANTRVGRKLLLWDGKSPLIRPSGGLDMLQEEGAEEEEEVELRPAVIQEEEPRQAEDESVEAEPEFSERSDEELDQYQQNPNRPTHQTSLNEPRSTLHKPTKETRGAVALSRHLPLRKIAPPRATPVSGSSRIRTISANLPISECTRKQKAERRQARTERSNHTQDTDRTTNRRPEFIKEETPSPKPNSNLHHTNLFRSGVTRPLDRQAKDENASHIVQKRKRNEQDENLPYRPAASILHSKTEGSTGVVGRDYRKAKRFRA